LIRNWKELDSLEEECNQKIFFFFSLKIKKKKKKKKKIKNQRILINQVSFRFICDVTFDVFNQKPAAQ